MNRTRYQPWFVLLTAISIAACDKPVEQNAVGEMAIREIHAIGYLEPPGELRRLSFAEDGIIHRVHVQMGESVKEGAILAELDSDLEERELAGAISRQVSAVAELKRLRAGIHPDLVAAAEARLKVAGEEMEFRKSEATRFNSLALKRGVSQSETDEALHLAKAAEARWALAKADLDALRNQPRPEEVSLAEAAIKEADAEVALAQEQLERRTLNAPCDGRVLEAMKREGEAFSTLGQDVAVLFAPEGGLQVRVEIDELDAHRIHAGMKAVVSPKGGATKADGVIVRIKPVMGRKTVFNRRATERMDLQVVEAWVELSDPTEWIMGMEVDVVIGIQESNP
jgi:multidrug resistance efflux pump